MVKRYVGREEYPAFLEATTYEHEEACGVISPGGASMLLRVSRARIYQILSERDDVRAWAYFEEGTGQRAERLDISVFDLIRYGVERGKVSKSDYGFFFGRAEVALARALQLADELEAVKRALATSPMKQPLDTGASSR